MADEPKEQQNQIQVQIDAQHATGVYSNLMMITHRKEEFILDFLFVQPQRTPQGQPIANLRSRVITTPEHMKRILKLDRLRLRGLSGAKDEVLMTATAQNLRRLVKFLCRPPPLAEVAYAA